MRAGGRPMEQTSGFWRRGCRSRLGRFSRLWHWRRWQRGGARRWGVSAAEALQPLFLSLAGWRPASGCWGAQVWYPVPAGLVSAPFPLPPLPQQ